MISETATAAKDIANSQFAIPAQEQTKRAKEETKRHLITTLHKGGIDLLILGIMAAMIFVGATKGTPIMYGLGSGGLVGYPLLKELIRKLSKRE